MTAWEDVVPHYNHSELQHINNIAKQARANQMSFENVEILQQDDGEQFVSEHIVQFKPTT